MGMKIIPPPIPNKPDMKPPTRPATKNNDKSIKLKSKTYTIRGKNRHLWCMYKLIRPARSTGLINCLLGLIL